MPIDAYSSYHTNHLGLAFKKYRKMKRIRSQFARHDSHVLGDSLAQDQVHNGIQAALSGSRQRIEETKRLEALCRYRKWNEEVFEPIQRHILRRLEQGTQGRQSSRIHSSFSSLRSISEIQPVDGVDHRLSARMWTRDKFDSTIEGLQYRVSTDHGRRLKNPPVELPGAPYQDHYNFASKFAVFADSEFPRGRRTITLPRFYRRNPILSTTV
jgi:hypothetical protein